MLSFFSFSLLLPAEHIVWLVKLIIIWVLRLKSVWFYIVGWCKILKTDIKVFYLFKIHAGYG